MKHLIFEFCMWFLSKYCWPETVPLTFYGSELIREGDIAIINNHGMINAGEVVSVKKDWAEFPTVQMRIFRRLK